MRRHPFCSRRRGLITLLVLVAMVAATLVALASLQRVAHQSRQNRWQGDRTQAVLLAESGAALAQVKLEAISDYMGETWSVPADQTSNGEPAQVVIEVSAESEQRRQIRVEVTLGKAPPRQAREALELTISLPSSENNG